MEIISIFFVFVAVIIVGRYFYNVNINHNFEEISKDRVYKSGVIPPEKIQHYVKKYNIKSIVDLRLSNTSDLKNNPEKPIELFAEKEAVEKIGGINYFNVGSDQVPAEKNLDDFFHVMDNNINYPVLIHCQHGEGRAVLYSALYRIEYEGYSNEQARKHIRFLLKWSSFDDGKQKGEFLKHYKTRSHVKRAC